MSLTDTQAVVSLVAALAILAGLAGVVVPGLPALPLCWGGVLVWALFGGAGPGRWAVLAAATVVAAGGAVVKYAWPGRNLKRTGVPTSSLLAGGLLGLIGFFVIPVVGLPIGFVGGIWGAERLRLGSNQLAWPATVQALKAAGLSMLVEFLAGVVIAALWVAGLLFA
ncbi:MULTISPECIES: DUF456 domain-containing protein [Micromonospora]|uniref:DUF456 domain-containing protein n=1 Tax=Micromonospora solifontis TaxID=2487138 RepID=A0ABX9WPI8_9ACTN|nr:MULTISPECIES: DUF456 domain-containing protein [Micromonospora]NES16092.1 DUF456 domain-containing protein [Micromonospora sp. PPF5-17B]NES34920.1 DUF456 domain-containing protein [Micromonospora solifontis]NES57638.1 DUF456 domain-containing protein [Micromonospora sp. PPF5-6]RNM01485.1 DUF456 domain-containing protein [Micromonospora solifontis]